MHLIQILPVPFSPYEHALAIDQPDWRDASNAETCSQHGCLWDRFSRLFFETVSEKQWLAHILCTAYKSQPCEPTSLNRGSYG